MDLHRTLEDHVANVRKTCFYFLNWIWKIRPFLTQDSAKTAVHVLAISKLDSCNSLVVNAHYYLIDKLQHVLNATVCVVVNKAKYDHITSTLTSLHWLPVPQRIKFKVLLITKHCLARHQDILLN